MALVNFVSRQQAEAFTPGNGGFFCLISIADPDVRPTLRPGWRQRLELRFHDLEGGPEDYEYRMPYAVFPAQDHCDRILDFGRSALTRGENVLVHCEAGVSRSGAAALALEALGFELPNRDRANCANLSMLKLFGNKLGREIVRPSPKFSGSIALW